MKLVAAKCPQCGASLDVNPKQETTKCKYCNQAIIIEDAIAKYKLEITGSIEVKNLPQEENILKLANRNYENKEYEEAYEGYDQIIKMDSDNTTALLRYGICKTLLNNYIDFKMDYLSKTFDNVVKILKEKSEYDKNINMYVEEIYLTTNKALEATIKYYRSYSINKSDLSQVQDKMFSCLDLYEKIFEHANEDTKKKIVNSISTIIYSIIEEKKYKTGDSRYGEDIINIFRINGETKRALEEKKKYYNSIINPNIESPKIENKDIPIKKTSDIIKDSNKETTKITVISIVGFLAPYIGIILLWTWGKNFSQKNKIIATIAMVIWTLFIVLSN